MGVYKRAREYTKNELVNKGRAITQRTYEYIKGTRVHRGQSNIKKRSNRARGYTNRARDYTKGYSNGSRVHKRGIRVHKRARERSRRPCCSPFPFRRLLIKTIRLYQFKNDINFNKLTKVVGQVKSITLFPR